MIKIFTLLNLAGLLVFNMFADGDIGVSQQLPARIDPGAEVRVNVTVNKADITGFAKLQIDLPAGLSATAIETKGASFTFADGKAKFIWMALPAQPSFEVSYTLSAASTANGTFPITGRLSYIADNERKTVDMAPATIVVGDGSSTMTAMNNGSTTASPVSTATSTNTTIPEAAALMNADETGNTASTTTDNSAPVTQQAPPQAPAHLSAQRVITPINSTTSLVTVSIDKGDLRGFGKLQENVPAGFTAVAQDTDDAIFTANGQVVKFVWLNLPSKSSLNVTYQLMSNSLPQDQYSVSGDFSYLLNDLTQQYALGQTSFTAGENAAVAQQPTPPAPRPAKAQPAPQPAPAPPAPQTVTARISSPKVSSIPAPESGISYKVQITAAHREVGHAYFIQRHHYDGDFSIEHNEGWIKYVTGDFRAYHDARARRQSYLAANYNFPGPFVTAYNNGERITVQEALMIARQHSAQ
jgi:hypothetical protein